MAGYLDEAADFVYSDPRRALARELSNKLSEHVAAVLSRYSEFDQRYRAVSGSTARDTHLPDDFDFDIGLLPRHGTDDVQFFSALGRVVSELAGALACDVGFCQGLAFLCATWPTDVRDALRTPQQKLWPDGVSLMTYKLKHGDRSIIEITGGRDAWLRFGLLYQSGWAAQARRLAPEGLKAVVSHICLLKRLAKTRGVYGGDGGGPASRGVEQLVMHYRARQAPLVTLLQRIANSPGRDGLCGMLYPVTNRQMVGLGLKPESRQIMRAFKPDGWEKYKKIATDVLNWR